MSLSTWGVAESSDDDYTYLPPEPQMGNIEYKLKLVNPSSTRLEHLVTQVGLGKQENRLMDNWTTNLIEKMVQKMIEQKLKLVQAQRDKRTKY